MCNCNPNHETERIEDRFHAVVYREKPCVHVEVVDTPLGPQVRFPSF